MEFHDVNFFDKLLRLTVHHFQLIECSISGPLDPFVYIHRHEQKLSLLNGSPFSLCLKGFRQTVVEEGRTQKVSTDWAPHSSKFSQLQLFVFPLLPSKAIFQKQQLPTWRSAS